MSLHNLHNQAIYAQNSTAAADFLAVNKPVQIALKHWLELLCDTDPIQVLELGSSSRPDRWQTIAKLPTTRSWQITLSDFSLDALPEAKFLTNTTCFYYAHKKLDLLSDSLPTHRYSAVLATYVFDAIWFPQDKYINSINYPGGLIAKVKEAFETCLLPTGTFISIDRTSTKFVPEYELSGPARFKTENYEMAKSGLEKHGFVVNLLSLNNFLGAAHQSVPLDLSDHSVLIVTKS